MKKQLIALIIFVLVISTLFILTKVDEHQNISNNQNIQIVVSNYALESMTSQIVGDKIDVQEAYDFKTEIHEKSSLTASETQNILQSSLFISISSLYEPFVKTIKEEVTRDESKVKVIEISDYYEPTLLDEHIFISPKQAIKINEIIYNQIVKIDPQNKDYYTKNYEEAIADLEEIDKQYQEFANQNTKTIYTEHDAYYWLREDYGLDIVGIHGKSHESEVSSKRIQEIIEDIIFDDTSTIFVENKGVIDSEVKTIKEETDVEIEVINNLEINNGLNYIDVYQSNLDTMKRVA